MDQATTQKHLQMCPGLGMFLNLALCETLKWSFFFLLLFFLFLGCRKRKANSLQSTLTCMDLTRSFLHTSFIFNDIHYGHEPRTALFIDWGQLAVSAGVKLWYQSMTVSHMPSVCFVLLLCSTNVCLQLLPSSWTMTCAPPQPPPHTPPHTHSHSYWWLTSFPECTRVFLGMGWIVVGWKGCVHAATCPVLLCAVLNITHVRILSAVMSLFKRGSSPLSFNYRCNGTR